MKSEDKMLIVIRRRKDLEPIRISLKKLLDSGGMENYLNLCADRLAENEMIDGEGTEINFADFPDILFTSEGLFSCRHILENYLPIDLLINAWQLVREVERENEEINSIAAAFRNMTLWQLWKCWTSNKKCEQGKTEAARRVRKWIVAELWSRSLISGIHRKANEALTQIYVNVKYRRLFDFMREASVKFSE